MTRKTISISSEAFERLTKFGKFGERLEVVFTRVLDLADQAQALAVAKAAEGAAT